jgi:hypothetical protein
VPFKSKAQQRFMFAAEADGRVPSGTAKRWAKHTPDMKGLPARVGEKDEDDEDKKAFVLGFLTRCVADGCVTPAQIETKAAVALASVKVAGWGDVAGMAAGAPLIPAALLHLVLPGVAGYAAGRAAGSAANTKATEDIQAMGDEARTAEYQRQAEQLALAAKTKDIQRRLNLMPLS